jgi:hypothetical protein
MREKVKSTSCSSCPFPLCLVIISRHFACFVVPVVLLSRNYSINYERREPREMREKGNPTTRSLRLLLFRTFPFVSFACFVVPVVLFSRNYSINYERRELREKGQPNTCCFCPLIRSELFAPSACFVVIAVLFFKSL